MVEFRAWPKTPRLFRDVWITEKLDGTNAAVIITEDGEVGAQSRNRLITPEDDNYGFARWVSDNEAALAATLGPGYHYGEWWGQGIQRGYGLTERRFSLFNTGRWTETFLLSEVPGLDVVPVLYVGPFGDFQVTTAMHDLRTYGSTAAPGFMRPEGIVMFHTASRQGYKALLENDERPKNA